MSPFDNRQHTHTHAYIYTYTHANLLERVTAEFCSLTLLLQCCCFIGRVSRSLAPFTRLFRHAVDAPPGLPKARQFQYSAQCTVRVVVVVVVAVCVFFIGINQQQSLSLSLSLSLTHTNSEKTKKRIRGWTVVDLISLSNQKPFFLLSCNFFFINR